jgi:hypothetical protein
MARGARPNPSDWHACRNESAGDNPPSSDGSPWIAAIGDTAVTNGGHADGFPVVGELIDDSVGADSQRVEASELATKRIASSRFAL